MTYRYCCQFRICPTMWRLVRALTWKHNFWLGTIGLINVIPILIAVFTPVVLQSCFVLTGHTGTLPECILVTVMLWNVLWSAVQNMWMQQLFGCGYIIFPPFYGEWWTRCWKNWWNDAETGGVFSSFFISLSAYAFLMSLHVSCHTKGHIIIWPISEHIMIDSGVYYSGKTVQLDWHVALYNGFF